MTQQKKKKKPTAAELKKRAKRKIAAAKKKLGVKRLPLRTSTSSTRFVLGKLLRSGRRSPAFSGPCWQASRERSGLGVQPQPATS